MTPGRYCPNCGREIDPSRMTPEEQIKRAVACLLCSAYIAGYHAAEKDAKAES